MSARSALPAMDPRTLLEGSKKCRRHIKREFDILSHRYIENDDKRKQADAEAAQKEIMAKYMCTHNFDPVTGTRART
jgi:hypothetical protein